MNSGKIVADGWTGRDGDIEGSTRGPRGPKKGLYWHEGTFASENYTARITVNQNLTQCRGKNTSRLAAPVTFYISASKCFLTGLSSKIC